jgi:hypothetical protein
MPEAPVKSKVGLWVVGIGTIALFTIFGANGALDSSSDRRREYWPKPGERGYEIRMLADTQISPAHAWFVANATKWNNTLGECPHNECGSGFAAVKGTRLSIVVKRTGDKPNNRVGRIRCRILEDGSEVSAQASQDPLTGLVNCAWIVGSNKP